jgi:hypothetical protein
MTPPQPLDELYLIWLYSQVADPDLTDPSLTFWKILRELYKKEFVWTIPNDDNRLEDGKALRQEFIYDEGLSRVDRDWVELGCSVLEVMVGLSRRLSFEADGEPYYWFWNLMENLNLHQYSDDRRLLKHHVEKALTQVIFRTYEKNGRGGFFPLKYPKKDQRKVELWDQISAYVLEHGE